MYGESSDLNDPKKIIFVLIIIYAAVFAISYDFKTILRSPKGCRAICQRCIRKIY